MNPNWNQGGMNNQWGQGQPQSGNWGQGQQGNWGQGQGQSGNWGQGPQGGNWGQGQNQWQQQPYQQQNMGGFGPGPNFKEMARGQGIDQNEYSCITASAREMYISGAKPLSTKTGELIKQRIGGEWFVFVSEVNSKNFDFCLTCVTGGDFLSFSYDNTMFQVCRLR